MEEISFCNNKTPRETRRQTAATTTTTTTKQRTRYYYPYRYTYRYFPVALVTAGVLVPWYRTACVSYTRELESHSCGFFGSIPVPTSYLVPVCCNHTAGSISSSGAPEFSSDTWLSTHLVPGTRYPVHLTDCIAENTSKLP